MKYLISRKSDKFGNKHLYFDAKFVKDIICDDGCTKWCKTLYDIELNTFEDLENLIECVGDIVIKESSMKDLDYKYEIIINDKYKFI